MRWRARSQTFVRASKTYRRICDSGSDAVVLDAARKALSERHYVLVAEAAELARDRLLNALESDLTVAYTRFLDDPEPHARSGAIRAIACTEPLAAEAVLRAKALSGDPAPEVIGDCLAGLLQVAPDETTGFVAGFLDDEDPTRSGLAALALETDLMLSPEGDWDGHAVPAYVERDFRRYLECGTILRFCPCLLRGVRT